MASLQTYYLGKGNSHGVGDGTVVYSNHPSICNGLAELSNANFDGGFNLPNLPSRGGTGAPV